MPEYYSGTDIERIPAKASGWGLLLDAVLDKLGLLISTKAKNTDLQKAQLLLPLDVTGNYTLASTATGRILEWVATSAQMMSVPSDPNNLIPVGAVVCVRQFGNGSITVLPATNVLVESRGNAFTTTGHLSEFTLHKRDTDEWVLSGDLVT